MPINFNKKIQTEFDVSPPVLSFTTQPTSQTVDYGASATLDAVAVATNPSTGGDTPSGTISYQWYKDGALMSGETSSSLILSAQNTAASYYCLASFTRSSDTAPAANSPLQSNTATISVRNQIVIVSFLGASGKTITLGESSFYSIDASVTNGDTSSLKYEWYVNNSLVKTDVGGTFSSLNLNPGSIGDYSIFCRISQGGASSSTSPSVDSNVVTLTVAAAPTPDPTTPTFPLLEIKNQKSDSDNYRLVKIFPSSEVRPWRDANPAEGVNLDSTRYNNAPTGGGAINFGVGQWEISSIDRDIEVVIELAGASGQGCQGHRGGSVTGAGQGGVGVVYLRMVKGQKYTLQVGRIGSAKKNNYPNENSPGGGQSGQDADLYSGTTGTYGNGGGGTFLYKGGRLIAVAGGGGGAAPGSRVVNQSVGTNYAGVQAAGAGGGPGLDGVAGGGAEGGNGGTQSQPGDNKNPSLYNKDSTSNSRPKWMLNGVCSSWVAGTRDGACDCTISNSTKTSFINGQRVLDDDDPSSITNQSCNTYATSKVI